MIFRSNLHRDIWVEHHCGRCYFGSGETKCKILDRADRTKRKPVEWERNQRSGALMVETIKCNSETRTPPKFGHDRPIVDEDVPMFDVEMPTAEMDSEHA